MGTEAFCRALQADADVVIAGRACDTAIFAAVPALLGCAMGPAMHMAKIIDCASLCCVPGGRDPILATLEGDSFVLESMDPERRATAMSVAAHSLYEQSDPDRVAEPEGVLLVRSARYEEIDDYRRSTSPPRESSERDRGFESRFLRRGVCLTGAFHGYRRKGPAFARSVSLDETRERDVLAASRLALAAFLWQALMQSPLWKIKAPQREEPR